MIPRSYEETLERFERAFGRPPIYFQPPSSRDEAVPLDVFSALLVDGHGALSALGKPARWTLKLLASVEFEFERLVCDQARAGIPLRQLQTMHGLGRIALRDILDRNGVPVGRRRQRVDVTDEQLREAFRRLGSYSAVAVEVRMHRTTVALRLAKCSGEL